LEEWKDRKLDGVEDEVDLEVDSKLLDEAWEEAEKFIEAAKSALDGKVYILAYEAARKEKNLEQFKKDLKKAYQSID